MTKAIVMNHWRKISFSLKNITACTEENKYSIGSVTLEKANWNVSTKFANQDKI